MGSADLFGYLLSQLDREDRAEVKGRLDALLSQEKYKKSNVLQFRKDGKTNGQTDRQKEDRKTDK